MAGVTFTLEASPTFPAGLVIGAYEQQHFPGAPKAHEKPLLAPSSFATNDPTTGLARFEGLKPDRRYYFGAEVSPGEWRWVHGTTDSLDEATERARAEDREAALRAELLGIPGKESEGIGPHLKEGGRVEVAGEGNASDFDQSVDRPGATLVPVEMLHAKEIVKCGGGQHFMIVLDKAGLVYHTGGSTFGQAGDGTVKDKATLHQIVLPELAVDISGHSGPLVLLASGRCMSWGSNGGQLGIGYDPGKQTARYRPTYVEAAPGTVLQNVHQIYAGHQAHYFLMGDGSVRHAGVGEAEGKHIYAETLQGLTGAVEVAGSAEGLICRMPDGTVKLKCRNQYGQHGDGTFDESGGAADDWIEPHVGPAYDGGAKVAEVDASEYNMAARLDDGTCRYWGRNHHGQIGNGYANKNPVPTVSAVGGGAFTGFIGTGEANTKTGKVLLVVDGEANVQVGCVISGPGVAWGTTVTAKISAGKYAVDIEQYVPSPGTGGLTARPFWKVDWTPEPGQAVQTVLWRATGLSANITGSIANAGGGTFTGRIDIGSAGTPGTKLTVTSGAANVKPGAVLSGSTILAGTEVLAETAAGVYTVDKAQLLNSSTLTATSVPTLTITAGASGAHYNATLKGGGVKGGTKLLRQFSASTWEVNTAQTTSSSSIEVIPPQYQLSAKYSSPVLDPSVVTWLIEKWTEPVIEVQIRSEANQLTPFDPGFTDVKQILSCGTEQSFGEEGDWYSQVLKEDGTVWATGGSKHGEAGFGDAVRRLTWTQVRPGELDDVISIWSIAEHSHIIRPGEPTETVRFTATPVGKDILVKWRPRDGQRCTGWKLEWQRVEGDPENNNKAEGFKHDTQGGVNSLKLPATTTEHTIKATADAENPGLPLPALWTNATNLIEIRLTPIYAVKKPTAFPTNLGARKWLVEWTDTNGPTCTVFHEDSEGNLTTTSEALPEPGYIVSYRWVPSEAFQLNQLPEVPPNSASAGKGQVFIEEVPVGATLEAEVQGNYDKGPWGAQTITVLPAEGPAEVPWLISPPAIVGSVPFGLSSDPDPLRRLNCNVVIQYKSETSVTGKAGAWNVAWLDQLNDLGLKEPGWRVRYKTVGNRGWNDPLNGGGTVLFGPGAGGTTITTSAKPEVRVEGTRAGVGDTVVADGGVWGGGGPQTFTYQWLRQYRTEGVPEEIPGATSASYQVTTIDAGHSLRCESVASNPQGEANHAASLLGTSFMGEPSMPCVGEGL